LEVNSVDTRNGNRLVYLGLRQLALTLLLITAAVFTYQSWTLEQAQLTQIGTGACLLFCYLLWRTGRKAKKLYQ
jgi:hypothetical protein